MTRAITGAFAALAITAAVVCAIAWASLKGRA